MMLHVMQSDAQMGRDLFLRVARRVLLPVWMRHRLIAVSFVAAVLAAGSPEDAPFMADEAVLAVPGISAPIKYDLPCYLQFAEFVQEKLKWLQGKGTSSVFINCILCRVSQIQVHNKVQSPFPYLCRVREGNWKPG